MDDTKQIIDDILEKLNTKVCRKCDTTSRTFTTIFCVQNKYHHVDTCIVCFKMLCDLNPINKKTEIKKLVNR
jgi:hypothetical protein